MTFSRSPGEVQLALNDNTRRYAHFRGHTLTYRIPTPKTQLTIWPAYGMIDIPEFAFMSSIDSLQPCGFVATTWANSGKRKDVVMNKPCYRFLLAALVVAILAGCSGDQGVAPRQSSTTMGRPDALSGNIGPSEIVFCLDVSDSISAGGLESVVNGLAGCLSESALIPQDSRVTLSVVVYADTIAAVLDRTPVTPENLQNVILPALQGLLNNRVVAGGGFDLSGALEKALTILGEASISDRHVLVVGSGAADDATAVGAACEALATAGVMVSALAVGADDAGAALLKSCADATGGFFGSGVACDNALAYMLQVDVDLEPESASLPRGEEHTVTATVFRGGDPQAYPEVGLAVIIEVVDGPNASVADTTATDAKGIVTLTYAGNGGPGTDTIVANVLHPGTGVALTDTVTVTWLNAPPTCDAGGPYEVVVAADTARVTLDAGSSSDAEGDPLSFRWSVLCEGGAWFDDDHAVSPVLTLTGDCLCVDSVMVELVVSDGSDSTLCEATVRIDDRRPPTIVMREDPLLLWPPNHKHHAVTPQMMIVSAEDACGVPIDVSKAVVVEVRSDEPDDANGDGRTIHDIRVTCPNLVDLRAERMGGGNGRVYTILYRIVADNGVGAEAEGRVFVPHDSSGRTVVEDTHGGYVVRPGCVDGN